MKIKFDEHILSLYCVLSSLPFPLTVLPPAPLICPSQNCGTEIKRQQQNVI